MTVAIEPDAVEQGFDALKIVAPTVAGDNAFRTWWDLAGNRAASPSMARAHTKVLAAADVRDTLARITAPTLILHRDSSRFVPVGHGRYLAEHIAGSRYVELPGADALYWVGDTAPLLDEIEEFITGVRGGFDAERVLTTIVFTDIVGSTERAAALGDDRWRDLLDSHDSIVRHELAAVPRPRSQHGRRRIRRDVHQPQRRDRLCRRDHRRGPGARHRGAGRHSCRRGRDARRPDDVAGMAVHIGARVAALAGPSEVLVSSTVREIVAGSRRTSPRAANTNSKACPVGGGCTRSCARRSAVTRRSARILESPQANRRR